MGKGSMALVLFVGFNPSTTGSQGTFCFLIAPNSYRYKVPQRSSAPLPHGDTKSKQVCYPIQPSYANSTQPSENPQANMRTGNEIRFLERGGDKMTYRER